MLYILTTVDTENPQTPLRLAKVKNNLIDAKIADYIILARRHGSTWYVGAMTDGTAREFDIDFSFLTEGEHLAEIMQDGVNADKNGIDYKKMATMVTNTSRIHIKLAPGGGWAAIIK